MWVGDKGLDVFEGFTFADPGDAAKLKVVVKKFEEYCAPRKNHIMAALKFSERRQGDHESFDSFVTDLKILVKDCGYQEEERMVRDAIVFRCKHANVREKCLDIADALTCEKAVEIQKKYHDRHASENMKELELGTKVRMQPWTDSKEWKPATVVRHHHTPRSYVVQAEDGRKYRRNRQHLRVCPASGHGRWTVSC